MDVLEFGRELLFLAVCLTVVIFFLAVIGVLLKDRRYVVASRTGFYALLVLIGASSGCLIYGFMTGKYNIEYIYRYSERSLGGPFKFAGLWAGLDGSILFWTLLLCGFSAIAAFQNRWSARHPVGRRIEPYLYMVLSSVIFFFIYMSYSVNPFEEMPLDERLLRSPDGQVPDGHGLNPQLENYWMAIHPPTLYLGLVGFTIPFAFSMASLMAREMGDYWIKVTRRWTLIVWTFLTIGIILGGLWAYEMLGWGGYWAWDPVENASILPWFVGTAFLHSVMVQERRDMLKVWNIILIIATFFMTIVATYMTRSGVVESVHAFSEGDVGNRFIPFMIGVAIFGSFLIGLRMKYLKGTHKLESFFSREAAFFFNNLILVALCATVYFLSMYGKISHDWLMIREKTGIPVYTMVTTPLFLLLLLLTGLGPQFGWVKTSKSVFFRRVFWPTILGLVACIICLPHWISSDYVPAVMAPDGQGGTRFDPWVMVDKIHYYSTLLGIGFSVFIVATVGLELYRSVRSRVKGRGETWMDAPLRVVFGNNRRYGGYIVHIGMALLAVGVIWSSNFRVKEEMEIGFQKPAVIPGTPYVVEWVKHEDIPQKGIPYYGEKVDFVIKKLDHVHPVADAQGGGHDHSHAVPVATLQPEMRRYDKQEVTISIPAISRNFINDYYIHYAMRRPSQAGQGESIAFTIFVNPTVNWIWAGAVLMLLGGIFAALPTPGKRTGLIS